MSYFLTLREQTRRELLTLVERDGIRTTAAKITRTPIECVVAACDGDKVDLTTRHLIEDHCARVHGRRSDYSERAEIGPELPKARLTRYLTDAVSRGVAQGYLALATGRVEPSPECYVVGSPPPCRPSVPDLSAPAEGFNQLMARLGRAEQRQRDVAAEGRVRL